MKQWLPMVLGAMLGFGGLLAWRGFRLMINKAIGEAERRKGFWWLNGGLTLVAASVVVFSLMARG